MLQFGVVFCYFARLLQIEVTPLKTFKQTLKRTLQRAIKDAAGECTSCYSAMKSTGAEE